MAGSRKGRSRGGSKRPKSGRGGRSRGTKATSRQEPAKGRDDGNGGTGGAPKSQIRYLVEGAGDIEKLANQLYKIAEQEKTALGLIEADYFEGKRRTYDNKHDQVLGHLASVGRNVAGLNKEVFDAQKDLEKAQSKARDYGDLEKRCKAAEGSAGKVKSAEERAEKAEETLATAQADYAKRLGTAKGNHAKLKYGLKVIAELKSTKYDMLKQAAKDGVGSDAYKAVLEYTMFTPANGNQNGAAKKKAAEKKPKAGDAQAAPAVKKERTSATDWLEKEAMPYMLKMVGSKATMEKTADLYVEMNKEYGSGGKK